MVHNGGVNGPFAISQGAWKFIPGAATKRQKDVARNSTGQLFNHADDLSETNKLAEQHPDKVKEMQNLLAQIREQPRSRPE